MNAENSEKRQKRSAKAIVPPKHAEALLAGWHKFDYPKAAKKSVFTSLVAFFRDLFSSSSSLSDFENEGPLALIIREKNFTRGQIFIPKRLQTPKSDRLLG